MLASHFAPLTASLSSKALHARSRPWYGFRLNLRPARSASSPDPIILPTRKSEVCLEHFSPKLFYRLCALLFLGLRVATPQTHPLRADLPPENEIWYSAVRQESNGALRYLRGDAKLETSEMVITADQIDYNSDTDWAVARGQVHLEHFVSGDNLFADHGEYNIKTQEGRFYSVHGTAPPKIMSGPGVLTTTNPFFFQAQWAQRIKDRYILHKGFLTDCKVPKPWWRLDAPVFDVIPGDRAIARNVVFRFKRVPIFYFPIFYRPLGSNPRQSGFLTPNIGHSSLYGYVYGLGYYWAINRSYDTTAIVQDFSLRGPALRYDFRGKPNDVTDFNFNLYGVKDRGAIALNDSEFFKKGDFIKEGGLDFELTATTELWGFTGRLDFNYLSSFLFRAAFASSLTGALSSDVYSIGFLQRHFKDDTYALNILMERNQLFESITFPSLHQRANDVTVQKLPAVEFSGSDQEITDGPIPIWFSFASSAGLLSREEPTAESEVAGPPPAIFDSGQVGRLDLQPRVSTAFSFKGFFLTPSVTLGATDYSNSYAVNTTTYTPSYPPPLPCSELVCPTVNVALANANLFRKNADFVLDFRTPSLEKIYSPPKWLHLGKKIKHVVETEATYEYVTGVDEFQKIIHFDATDILSNTNQLTISLTNRLYKKDRERERRRGAELGALPSALFRSDFRRCRLTRAAKRNSGWGRNLSFHLLRWPADLFAHHFSASSESLATTDLGMAKRV